MNKAELNSKQIGDTMLVKGNIFEVSLKKGTNEYHIRNKSNMGMKWIEQKLRIQLDNGEYMTCWAIVPPYYEAQHKGAVVNFSGQVAEFRNNRFLEACGAPAASKAMAAPTGDQPPTPPANTPQAPSQPTGQANGKEEVDWDAKDLRTARENGLNNATKIICLLAEMTKNDASLNIDHVKRVASDLVDYIYNGLKGKGPQAGETPPDEFDEAMRKPESPPWET